MNLNFLRLRNYRNIESVDLELSERVNLFIGDNGQGKTNILESVHVLVENESFRYSDLSTLIHFGKDNSVLNTVIHNNDLEYNVQMVLYPKKKEVLLNGKKTSKIYNYLPPVVLFSPESLSIIKESSDERRQLTDNLVKMVYKNGQNIILDFKKALRTRNKVLKDYKDEKIEKDLAMRTLESLNPIYLKLATELTSLRINSLCDIKNEVQNQLNKINAHNKCDFDFQYVISDQIVSDFSLQNIHNLLSKRASELALAELASGQSLVGPQKHDVIFVYNGKDSRFFSSQGQQRSIILAFKMAQIVYHQRVHGFYPILLLDDVLSELDQTKQAALIMALNEIQTQTFLTTTDVDVLKQLNMEKSKIYKVREGKIN